MLASLVGGIADAFQGDPTYDTLRNTKNPAIEYQQNQILGDLANNRQTGYSALRQYIAKYLAGTPTATANTGQEIGAIGGFYNGDVARQLEMLRNTQRTATTNAADVASQQALRNVDLSRLGGDGTGGSYDQRLAMANLTPIRVQAALTDANQARADYGYLTGEQLALAGRRTVLQDALDQRMLEPWRAKNAFNAGNMGAITGLSALDLANNIYGIKQNRTTIDRLNQAGGAAEGAVQGSVDKVLSSY